MGKIGPNTKNIYMTSDWSSIVFTFENGNLLPGGVVEGDVVNVEAALHLLWTQTLLTTAVYRGLPIILIVRCAQRIWRNTTRKALRFRIVICKSQI